MTSFWDDFKPFLFGLLLGALLAEAVILPVTFLTGWDSDAWNLVCMLWGIACGCGGVVFMTSREL